MLGEVVSLFTLVERVQRLWDRIQTWRSKRRHQEQPTLTSRFLLLFERHGIHRNQIPRFFGHGLTAQDVSEETALLPKLTEEVLDAACERFGTRREWLDGADDRLYPRHDFYPSLFEFQEFLQRLKKNNPKGQFSGVLVAPSSPAEHAQAILIIEELIGQIGERGIYRYHLCPGWMYGYWKSRGYLTACVAMAWKSEIYVQGRYADAKYIERLAEGGTFLAAEPFDSFPRWYTEDMALVPEDFLRGIDPEVEDFGHIAGLKLWLRFESEGFMDTGHDKNPRPSFLAQLDNYKKGRNLTT